MGYIFLVKRSCTYLRHTCRQCWCHRISEESKPPYHAHTTLCSHNETHTHTYKCLKAFIQRRTGIICPVMPQICFNYAWREAPNTHSWPYHQWRIQWGKYWCKPCLQAPGPSADTRTKKIHMQLHFGTLKIAKDKPYRQMVRSSKTGV